MTPSRTDALDLSPFSPGGSLGPVGFGLLRPLQSATHEHRQTWVEHEVAGGKGIPEHTGEPLDTVSLSVRLWAASLLHEAGPGATDVPPAARFPRGLPGELVRDEVVRRTLGPLASAAVQVYQANSGQVDAAVSGALRRLRRESAAGDSKREGVYTKAPAVDVDVTEDVAQLIDMARAAQGYPLFVGSRFHGWYAIERVQLETQYLQPKTGVALVADVSLDLLEVPTGPDNPLALPETPPSDAP